MNPSWRFLSRAAALLFTCLVAGCGGSGTGSSTGGGGGGITTPPTGSYTGNPFTGQVLAGSSPVVGASVQLYQAGTTGKGSAPTQLLSSSLITDANGSFSVSSYTCAASSSVLYLLASGGHAGTGGSTNPGIVMMSSPGACSSVTGTPKFMLNEATTVASAYAFAQFLGAVGSTGGQLGATSTNTSGITLAAGTLANLVGLTTGVPSTTIGNAPAQRIAALANALHSCAASSGASSAGCTGLYAAATVSGTVPANLLDAALSVVRHPANNIAGVFALAAGGTAFLPALAVAPSDWTLFVTYTGGGMNDPARVAIDSQGRVWVSNFQGGAASLFSNTGVPAFASGVTGNNLNESYGAAVDASDNVWITNQQTGGGINGGFGNITVLSAAGQAVNGSSGYSTGGISFPVGLAFDTTGVAWVVDYGNSHLTLLSASGSPQSGVNGYADLSLAFPVAVAVDSKRNGWIANQASSQLVKVAPDGSSFTAFTTGSSGSSVAIDESDDAWVTNYFGDSVGLVSAAGQVLSSGGFVGGGLSHPQAIAIDGAGTAWVANYLGPSLSELAAANSAQPGQILSPSAGWGPDAALSEAYGLAIDASGNLWVSSYGSASLTEFVGMAAPVRTPLIGPVRVP